MPELNLYATYRSVKLISSIGKSSKPSGNRSAIRSVFMDLDLSRLPSERVFSNTSSLRVEAPVDVLLTFAFSEEWASSIISFCRVLDLLRDGLGICCGSYLEKDFVECRLGGRLPSTDTEFDIEAKGSITHECQNQQIKASSREVAWLVDTHFETS